MLLMIQFPQGYNAKDSQERRRQKKYLDGIFK